MKKISLFIMVLLGSVAGPAWAAGGVVKSPTGVAPDRYVYYPGTEGLPNPMSDFIKSGKWKEGYDAQNGMLDEYMKHYGLEQQDWRKGYWE